MEKFPMFADPFAGKFNTQGVPTFEVYPTEENIKNYTLSVYY